MDTPPPPPLKYDAQFKLWPVSFALAVVAVVALAAFIVYRSGGEMEGLTAARIAGAAFAIIIFPLLIAKVVFRLCRRSNKAANIAAMVVLVLLVAGQASLATRTERNRAIIDKMLAQNEPDRNAMVDEIQEKRYLENVTENTETAVKRMEDASKELSGPEAKIVRAGAAVVRRMNEIAAPYHAATKELALAGGMGLDGIRTPDDAKARRTLVETLGKANDELHAYLKGIRNEVQRELRRAGVPEAHIPGAIDGFLRGMNYDTAMELRQSDAEMTAAARDYYTVLVETKGKWTIEDGEIQIDDSFPDAAADRFNAALEKMTEVSERQQSLLDSMRAPK